MRPIEEWAIFTRPWTETLSTCDCRIRFLTFDYDAILDDKFSLECFHEQGEILLNSLLRHHEIHGVSATENMIGNEKRKLNLKAISKPACARIAGETPLLLNISSLFQEIELRVDILSIYETKDTNLRTRFTDEEAVKTNSPREQCFGLAGSHTELWRLEQDDGLPDQRLMEWMRFCFGKDNLDAVRKKAKSDMLFKNFSQIAVKLGLEDISEPRNPVVSRELAKGWLENPRRVINQQGDIIGQAEAHWLLIFDNADKPDALQDYWPVSSNGSVLVTSRDPLSKTTPSIAAESIDLEPFDIPEAAAFLRSIAHYEREEDLSIEIAKKLGGLPLAISQMAAMIRYQYLSFSDFLNQYEDESNRKQIHAYELGALRREARGNIATIWAIEQLEPQAKTILELSAVLDPDCIPDRLFQEKSPRTNELEHYPRTGFEFSVARADLIKRSLINRNDEKKEFWIHRILQDCVLMKMSPKRMERVFSAASLLDMRLKAFEVSGQSDIRLAIAHNEMAIAWVMNGQYENAIQAFQDSITVYGAMKDYRLAIDTNPRTNLGFTHWIIGQNSEAYAILEELLRDREIRFGKGDTESYRTGRVYHGLGNIRYDQGRFEESEEWHEKALSHYQVTLGNNHHKTADLCHRVAQHCIRRGESTSARILVDQALKVWRVRESVYAPEIARTTFLKAKIIMKQGDESKARELFKDAKSLRNRIPRAPEKADADLRESDFDELVTFFSR
ncbi:MAG: hypothetical protein Q9165_002450 [Trypethelium subeluteriae]